MQWKPIKGYEDYYEVSDTGLVRSLDRVIPDKVYGSKTLKGKPMRLSVAKSRPGGSGGYYVVNLRKNSTSHVVPVHRLVAQAFITNTLGLPTVNHKDGNKQNNAVSNLEWASYSDNNQHALAMNLRHPRGVKVIQIDSLGNVIGVYRSVSAAARATSISRGMISHCIHHRALTAGGYRWKKIEKCNDYLDDESTAEDELPLEVQERNNSEDIV